MRLKYLDFLRQFAIFYMFFHHTALILLKPQFNSGIVLFLFEIAPFCPAIFLFLAGFSITLHLKKNDLATIDAKYFLHLFARGMILILCASFFFVVEHGFQFPDFIFCGNILNTIGWMIIISGLLLMLKNNKVYIAVFFVLIVGITIFLDLKKIYLVPFNNGYEPMSPTIVFGFMGLLTGIFFKDIKDEKKINIFVISMGIIGLIIFTFFSIKYGIFRIFFSDTGRYFIVREFNENLLLTNIFGGLKTNTKYTAEIWNYNSECMIASMGTTMILFSISFFLEKNLFKHLPRNIFIPGKFAFLNYFFHLFIIALFILFVGYNFMNTFQYLLLLAGLYVFSYLLSFSALFVRNRLIPKKI
jgi:hypothetical protein